MKIDTVYVDMDGVIVAFFEFVQLYLPQLKADHLPENKGVIYKFMDEFTSEFRVFSILPPKVDIGLAFKTIEELTLKGINVEILSSCGTSKTKHEIREDKIKWLQKYGLAEVKANFVEGSIHKGAFGSPSKILIDDYHRPGKYFTDAGGHWIHHKDWATTIKELEKILNG